MFEKATRLKLRFTSYKGSLSVEDLWDLSLNELDSMFKKLNVKSREQNEESLLDTKNPQTVITELKIDIVKHIVAVKLAEKEANEKATERRAHKQKLMGVLEEKQDADLRDLSKKKLQKLIDELDE